MSDSNDSVSPKGGKARGELKRTETGVVTGDKRDKTRSVVVNYLARHEKYEKYVRRRTRYHVHDENNESRLGDLVEIAYCRPFSKTKSWRLVRVVERAPEPIVAPAAPAV